MFQGFTGWHALIILVVILLLFGAPKLPALARSLGQSMKILKTEVRSDKSDESGDASAPTTSSASPPVTATDGVVKAAEPTSTTGTADSARPSS